MLFEIFRNEMHDASSCGSSTTDAGFTKSANLQKLTSFRP